MIIYLVIRRQSGLVVAHCFFRTDAAMFGQSDPDYYAVPYDITRNPAPPAVGTTI